MSIWHLLWLNIVSWTRVTSVPPSSLLSLSQRDLLWLPRRVSSACHQLHYPYCLQASNYVWYFIFIYLPLNNTKCIKILSLSIKIFYCLDPHFWNVNFRRASTCSVLFTVISSALNQLLVLKPQSCVGVQ